MKVQRLVANFSRIFFQYVRRNMLFCLSAVASASSIAMILVRSYYVGELSHKFLIWNLFLAWVPLIFSKLCNFFEKRSFSNRELFSLGFLWLIFLPNAPYIITDFIHLHYITHSQFYFDLLMFQFFAGSGILAGLSSLIYMREVIRNRLGELPARLGIVISLLLCGLGVYIGRFLRWNSWDILMNPTGLMIDVLQHLITPGVCFKLFFFVGFFALFLGINYLLLSFLIRLPVRSSYF
ncbi:MAG: hypothetical protein B6244_04700 [Candidatus Cloacimonetes bacterium 4572_55]|nr:MAG: hypothetical protein B6244_04700 [Candidatus Cloacimonetes bacterium 4572_55]